MTLKESFWKKQYRQPKPLRFHMVVEIKLFLARVTQAMDHSL